jgi:hypothetical protein
MAKKISQRRIQQARGWLHGISDEDVAVYGRAMTPALKRAADAFGLDPLDPYHRGAILNALAQLVFGNGKRGRPKETYKWAGEREYNLGYHYYLLQPERPDIKFSQAARIIKKRWRGEYADCTEMTLRQRMRAALEFFEKAQKDWAEQVAIMEAEDQAQREKDGGEADRLYAQMMEKLARRT